MKTIQCPELVNQRTMTGYLALAVVPDDATSSTDRRAEHVPVPSRLCNRPREVQNAWMEGYAAAVKRYAAHDDMRVACSELVAEWDADHEHEDHRTGFTPETDGVRMARAAIARAEGGEA